MHLFHFSCDLFLGYLRVIVTKQTHLLVIATLSQAKVGHFKERYFQHGIKALKKCSLAETRKHKLRYISKMQKKATEITQVQILST